MDFLTVNDAPYPINVKGVTYPIPRFLSPALKEWAAQQLADQRDAATAHLSPDDKARFLMYFRPVAVDVRRQLQEAQTAAGAEFVLRRQLPLGGVPAELVEQIIAHGDPQSITDLSTELTQLPQATKAIDAVAGVAEPAGDDPLKSPPPPSGGGASTGPNSPPDSSSPTPVSTPTSSPSADTST